MKIFVAFLLTFLTVISWGQPIISWEEEIFVTQTNQFGNTRPRITLAANDVPVVIFGKTSTGLLYTARLNGSSFDTPVTLLPGTVSSYLTTWTGPDIASKGDTVIAVFKAMSMDLGKVYALRSIDGGITFSDTIRVDNHDSGHAWMPSLDMDENGNPSIVYMAHDASMTNPRYNVVHSIDQGITYQPEMEIALSIPDEACDCCPAEYVIDGAQHALLYRNNDVNIRDIYAVYSDDDGANYSSYANVNNLNWTLSSCPSTGPHGIFNNGKLLTASASAASGKYRAYLSETVTSPSLVLQSQTMMTPPQNINGVQNYPRISGKNDTVVLIWQENSPSNNDIFSGITVSGSIQELLDSKAIVNDSTLGSQSNPDIIYANGKIHCVFQDAISGKVIYKRGILSMNSISQLPNQDLIVFPNPLSTSLTIKSNLLTSSYTIYNVLGEIVQMGVLTSLQTEVNLSALSNGTYQLIIGKDQLKSFQIIKNN
ncbi:MAG: T9SS C-terminal target domain-containing protein [Crocinitomicaceae bacterium]|nr:T9SS C-terminal target domain-containing protein [Crocinitomicaceae bacterium]